MHTQQLALVMMQSSDTRLPSLHLSLVAKMISRQLGEQFCIFKCKKLKLARQMMQHTMGMHAVHILFMQTLYRCLFMPYLRRMSATA